MSRPEVYERCLLDSVNKCRKQWDIEVVPILNIANLYSAANALNHGIDVSHSDIIVFAHQDVRLLDGWFDRLIQHWAHAPDDMVVLGAAGIDLQYGRDDIGPWGGSLAVDTVAVGTVYDSDTAEQPYWRGTTALRRVHCVDECCFSVDRKINLRFDTSFSGFHFYGVDLCLQARAAGLGIYTADLPVVHYGQYSTSFAGDKRYWIYLRHLYNKWKLRFPELLGTHMHWAKDELTSYIPLVLQSDLGTGVQLKGMGIKSAKFKFDKKEPLWRSGDDLM